MNISTVCSNFCMGFFYNCFIGGLHKYISSLLLHKVFFVDKGTFGLRTWQTISIIMLETDALNQFHRAQHILLKFNNP